MLREPKYDWFSVEAQRDAQEREEQNFREAMRALVRFLGFVAVDGSGFWWGGAWEGIDRQVEPMPLPTTGLFEAAGDIKVDPDGNLQFAERLGDMVLPWDGVTHPAFGPPRPPVNVGPVEPLTQEEAEKLLEQWQQQYNPPIVWLSPEQYRRYKEALGDSCPFCPPPKPKSPSPKFRSDLAKAAMKEIQKRQKRGFNALVQSRTSDGGVRRGKGRR